MDMKLEVVVLPVSDVDKAKDYYQTLGFHVDIDHTSSADFRVVQLTPPGSNCSIIIGVGLTTADPGSVQGLHLIVADIEVARNDLVSRGIEVSEVFHDAGGIFHHAGNTARVSGVMPGRPSKGSFASFSDPDGNGWFLQEVR